MRNEIYYLLIAYLLFNIFDPAMTRAYRPIGQGYNEICEGQSSGGCLRLLGCCA